MDEYTNKQQYLPMVHRVSSSDKSLSSSGHGISEEVEPPNLRIESTLAASSEAYSCSCSSQWMASEFRNYKSANVPITCQLHGNYMPITCQSHDTCARNAELEAVVG